MGEEYIPFYIYIYIFDHEGRATTQFYIYFISSYILSCAKTEKSKNLTVKVKVKSKFKQQIQQQWNY